MIDTECNFRVEMELDYSYHVEVEMSASSYKDLENKIQDKYGGNVRILNTEVL
jgi:hypothetical protein